MKIMQVKECESRHGLFPEAGVGAKLEAADLEEMDGLALLVRLMGGGNLKITEISHDRESDKPRTITIRVLKTKPRATRRKNT